MVQASDLADIRELFLNRGPENSILDRDFVDEPSLPLTELFHGICQPRNYYNSTLTASMFTLDVRI